MATVGLANIRIPAGNNAPAGPGQLAELALDIDPHLILHVADLAERNSLYAGAPANTMVSAADGSLWKKTASDSNSWVTWWEPLPAWRTLPLATGYQEGTLTPQIRMIGKQVHTRGRIVRTDGGLIVGTDGVQIATVPNDTIPEQSGTSGAYFSLTGPPLIGAGRYEVRGKNDTPPGALVFYSQDGAQDGGAVGCTWVDVSGSYWLD
ncbi:hypothetical protein [Streptomyces sp. NPDC059883]|uniref:hypothetical protein n=1 Tax=unclassified Streptomyces TaxID=2593676 RepID=UPI003662E811